MGWQFPHGYSELMWWQWVDSRQTIPIIRLCLHWLKAFPLGSGGTSRRQTCGQAITRQPNVANGFYVNTIKFQDAPPHFPRNFHSDYEYLCTIECIIYYTTTLDCRRTDVTVHVGDSHHQQLSPCTCICLCPSTCISTALFRLLFIHSILLHTSLPQLIHIN